MTDQDLEAFINLSKKYGILEKDENIRIKKILKLDELSVADIMTPRIKIKAIQDTLTIQEAIKKISKTSYSRFPVYHTKIDDAHSITTLKELIRLQEQHGGEMLLKAISFDTCILLDQDTDLNSALALFKQTHKHLGLVTNTTKKKILGVVSLEDILEEVFGEIQDEADQETTPISPNKKGIICQSYVRLDEALTALDIDFDDLEDEHITPSLESTTLNYFIIKYLGRFPKKYETINISLATLPDDGENTLKRSPSLVFKVMSIKKSIIGEIQLYIS